MLLEGIHNELCLTEWESELLLQTTTSNYCESVVFQFQQQTEHLDDIEFQKEELKALLDLRTLQLQEITQEVSKGSSLDALRLLAEPEPMQGVRVSKFCKKLKVTA